MRRLVGLLAACAALFTACELMLPNGDPAGVFPVGTGVHQLSTGAHQPEVIVDQAVYPDGSGPFVGVQFKINGVVDARHSARPNGVDATGPNEPGSGRFHIYPDYNFQPCDTVSARWYHEGVEWGASAQVPGAACSGTSTTTTAAPTTTTVPTTTTTTAPPTTTTTAPPTTTTQPPVGGSYFEDFNDGDGLAGIEVHVDHRDEFLVSETSWQGEHALITGNGHTGETDCTGPDQTHTITRAQLEAGAVYVCDSINGNPQAGHLMTAMGDTSGYSVVSVLPDQTFIDVTEVRWDANLTNLGNRQWLEVKVLPVGSFDIDNPPCGIPWLANSACGNEGIPAGGVAAVFFNHEVSINVGGQRSAYWGKWYEWIAPGDPALTNTMIRRSHFLRDNGNNTITFGIEKPDGSFFEYTAVGSFPSGDVRVVFADHNYTPHKDGAMSSCQAALGHARCHTWHLDNLAVD